MKLSEALRQIADMCETIGEIQNPELPNHEWVKISFSFKSNSKEVNEICDTKVIKE